MNQVITNNLTVLFLTTVYTVVICFTWLWFKP